MKKLLLIPCLFFGLNAYCQSFIFKEIMHLSDQKDIKSYLKSKSFELLNKDGVNETYVKNGRTNKEEIIYYSPRGTSYNALDANYIRVLLKQIQLHQIIKDENLKLEFYQFGDIHLNVMVNISKTPGTQSNISVERK